MSRPLALLLVLALLGCGARTDLSEPTRDASSPAFDASRPDAAVAFDAGPDAALPDAGRDAGLPDAGPCAPPRVIFSRELPMLVVILDRSGSMRNLFRRWTPMFPSASRWEVVRELLVGSGDAEGLVQRTRARIGLSTYTSTSDMCPFIRFVPPEWGNAMVLRDELESLSPRGGTPTAEAIRDALARVPEHREGGEPVAFLLATDGAPGGCGAGGGEAGTVAAVEEAYDAGVRTFVISVGTDTEEAHLQDVANAGLGLDDSDGDATFWVGRSPNHLAAALTEAAARAVSCFGRLDRRILDMDRACEVSVTVGDTVSTCDDLTDGYRFPDPAHIELFGASCGALREGDTLALDAPCDLLAE